MTLSRYKIRIEGAVQGIGFRPFVYRQAIKNSIAGHVYNDSSGVTIEAEGRNEDLENFIETVRTSPPPFAQIHSFVQKELNLANEIGFKITKSKESGEASTLISPDIATCSDCLNDISNPSNRRHRYPFTNCTNCGPRYTIIEGVPYDRPYTAMKTFKMCPECEAEYIDPLDRRYHAQPNACPVCGPKLTLIKNSNIPSSTIEIQNPRSKIQNKSKIQNPNEVAIFKTIKLLNQGKIVAIKGLGGFHLACDATNEEAVLRLRRRKARDEKPFAVMMPDAETVRRCCELNEAEEAVLTSPQRPIVLLRKKITESPAYPEPFDFAQDGLRASRRGRKIAEAVAPNNSYLGVMLPYTPLHYLLFTKTPTHQNTDTPEHQHARTLALVMTSANISDEPICFKNEEALERLKDIADYFLIHERDIFIRTDDSVTRIMNGRPLMLRRGRGYAPQPIIISGSRRLQPAEITHPKGCGYQDCATAQHTSAHRHIGTPAQILAVGAELKNTVCLLKGDKAFISQHIGDLENTASYESFEKTINHLRNLFDIKPTVVAHDMHPNYFSTRWAHCHCGEESNPVAAGSSLHPSSLLRASKIRTLKGATTSALIEVQHHHAHIASCMAENQIDGPVIGIALDGTGYGTDGNIWGGEILLATYTDFERAGQFEYVPMPGSDAAIKNPWQMALAYLSVEACPERSRRVLECRSVEVIKSLIPSFRSRSISDDKIDLVITMIEKGINSPLTSSCGRLFDAVAAILGIRHTVSFEGQAAMELEMEATKALPWKSKIPNANTYPYKINSNNVYITISYTNTIKAILEDIRRGISVPEIALKFHNTLVAALTDATIKISGERGIRDVALSGGCFQNVLLTKNLKDSLEQARLTVYTHSLVPPNDGGIALGQAAIARAIASPKSKIQGPKQAQNPNDKGSRF